MDKEGNSWKKDRTFRFIFYFALALGVLTLVTADTPHWLYNIGAGAGMFMLVFTALCSAFMPQVKG